MYIYIDTHVYHIYIYTKTCIYGHVHVLVKTCICVSMCICSSLPLCFRLSLPGRATLAGRAHDRAFGWNFVRPFEGWRPILGPASGRKPGKTLAWMCAKRSCRNLQLYRGSLFFLEELAQAGSSWQLIWGTGISALRRKLDERLGKPDQTLC